MNKQEAIDNIEEMIQKLEVEDKEYEGKFKLLINPLRLRIKQLQEVKLSLLLEEK